MLDGICKSIYITKIKGIKLKAVSKKLIKKLQNRDADAFRIIFDYYSSKIYYLALKYTQNIDDSNDCVQEVFLRILNHIQDFNIQKANFGTWVYTITMNYLKDKMKCDCRRKKVYCLDNDTVYEKGVSSDIHTNIQLSEIEKAVGEESYQILLLKVGLHMTFDEISRELGETPSKIKRIYYSAYEKAREYVKRGDMNEKSR